MKPDISIIIPAFNEAKVISATINAVNESIFSGTYEILVVCNGCTDNTAEVAKRSGATVIESPEKGTPNSLNLGAQRAKGNILVFLDADTLVSKNLLQETLDAYSKGYVGGRTVVKWASTSIWAKVFSLISYVHKYKWGGFCFVTKDVFNEVGGYKIGATYGFDFDLGRRVTKGRKVAFLRKAYVLTSDRRFEKEGWLKHFWLAIKRYYVDELLLKKGVKYEDNIEYGDYR